MEDSEEIKLGRSVAVGIDAGGTFTDLVGRDAQGRERVWKVPSTKNPAEAVLAGLRALLGRDPEPGDRIVHGTTVATNALLEQRGAATALVTNAGFEDVLEIARQTRPKIYALQIERPLPLVPRELRLGVRSRTLATGEVRERVSDDELRALVTRLRESRVQSVAVSLLHSYTFPEEEKRIGAALRELSVPVTLSSDLLPVIREYERTATTVANAYLAPLFARYLDDLDRALTGIPLRIMQSNGGSISATKARDEPVRAVLSGPAGGALGALRTGILAGFPRVTGLDMGGTSTDVCVLDGRVEARSRSEVGGVPVAVPTLDVHTVGAGGGSLAWRDTGGALRVGPRSAGAVPGPVSYGRGGKEVTLTDAHVVLGTMRPSHFLGGRIPLDGGAARAVVSSLAASLGIDPMRAARGVVEIALARMERALRVVTVERGIDPRAFTLVAFGGAGPLHAAELARRLGMPRALVPRDPGALSARGMLDAPAVIDAQRSVARNAHDAAAIKKLGAELAHEVNRALEGEGYDAASRSVEVYALARYKGQAHELELALGDDLAARFHAVHEARNGYRDESRSVEVVTVRARATGALVLREPARATLRAGDGSGARLEKALVVFADGARETWILDRERLHEGEQIVGPAVIVDPTATTVVPPLTRASVDALGNLLLENA